MYSKSRVFVPEPRALGKDEPTKEKQLAPSGT